MVASTTPSRSDEASPSSEAVSYEKLVDALRSGGATIRPAGRVEQPFFTFEGQTIIVNGAEVQAFEYDDEDTRRAESSAISADGSTIGTTNVAWTDRPNFWAKGRLIVLYLGTDRAIMDRLSAVLGPPLTRNEATAAQPPQAALEARRRLAESLSLAEDRIRITSFEQIEWADACLGLAAADEVCAQAITPGWRVRLEANGRDYEARTDESATSVRVVQ